MSLILYVGAPTGLEPVSPGHDPGMLTFTTQCYIAPLFGGYLGLYGFSHYAGPPRPHAVGSGVCPLWATSLRGARGPVWHRVEDSNFHLRFWRPLFCQLNYPDRWAGRVKGRKPVRPKKEVQQVRGSSAKDPGATCRTRTGTLGLEDRCAYR